MGNFFNKRIVKNTFILTAFAFLGKTISAIFKIGLSNVVGSFGMGIYQLVFPVMVFFIVLSSEGVGVALTIKTAQNNIEKRVEYGKLARVITLLFSIVSGTILVLFSRFLTNLQGGVVPTILYVICAVGVVIISMLSVVKAQLRGEENFKLYSILDMVEDILKVVFALCIGLFLMDKGVVVAITGVIIGIILSSLVTLLLALILQKKNKKVISHEKLTKLEKQEFIKFSVVSSLSKLIVPTIQFIETTLVIKLLMQTNLSVELATRLFGISKGSVSAIINLPSFALCIIETLLLPSLSRSRVNGLYFKKANMSVVLAVFITMPFMFLFVLFPDIIISVIYPLALTTAEKVVAVNLLKIGSIAVVFSSISSVCVVILNCNNKSVEPLIASIVAGALKLTFLVVFTKSMSIYALEFSSVLFGLVSCVINLFCVRGYKEITDCLQVVPVMLFWSAIFGLCFILYNMFKAVLSPILASLVSLGIILVILGVLFAIFFKKIKESLNNLV